MDHKNVTMEHQKMQKQLQTNNKPLDVSAFYLDPEDDNGNHEYKYKLVGLSKEELEGKITQLNFRLDEGNGEAIYEIGVTDDGCPLGITQVYLDETLKNVQYMADQIDATVQVIDTSESPISLANESNKMTYAKCHNVSVSSLSKDDLDAKRYICELLIRRNNHENNYVGLRIAVAGNVDAGKSTTVGVLTQGINDDGNGMARQHVFNFKHEIETGRTTSVAQEILGFDSKGEVVNEKLRKLKAPSWPDIVKESSKICTFYDMAGHEKYFNTTIRGISGIYPDYCLIMIGSNMGITQMTREHMIVCLMRGIPMIAIFTKIDMAPEHITKKNIIELEKLLKGPGVNKTPFVIKSKRDVLNCCHNISSGVIVPIIKISNVTGENLDLLKTLLNCLPPRINYHDQLNKPARYTIQETFQVPGIGTVVSGFLMSGVVSVKNTLWLGPDSTGIFKKVTVRSIHDKRTDVNNAFAGQSVCFALRGIARNQIRRGMMMIDGKEPEPKGIIEFEAEIEIFGRHSTSVRIGYEPVIHISNIKQAAKIVEIHDVIRKTSTAKKKDAEKPIPDNDIYGNPVLRAGDKARVKFQFCFAPVYFELNSKILFREGRTRGVGVVEKIIDLDESKSKIPKPESGTTEDSATTANKKIAVPGRPPKLSASQRRKLKKQQIAHMMTNETKAEDDTTGDIKKLVPVNARRIQK